MVMFKKIIFFLLLLNSSLQLYILIGTKTSISYGPLKAINCPFIDENYYYRGRPTNIIDILEKENYNISNKTKLEEYHYVYVPNYFKDTNILDLFPQDTIFFKYGDNYALYDKCKIDIDSYDSFTLSPIINDNDKTPYHYYLVISNNIHIVNNELDVFSIVLSIFLVIYYFCKYCNTFRELMPLESVYIDLTRIINFYL